MPQPSSSITPTAAWNTAETAEMEEVIGLYGKVYHFWQVDRGDKVPLGGPELMLSFTDADKVEKAGGWEKLKKRDENFKVDSKKKAEQRADIAEPQIHPGKKHFHRPTASHDRSRCISTTSDALQMPIKLGKSSDGQCRLKVQGQQVREDILSAIDSRPTLCRTSSGRRPMNMI